MDPNKAGGQCADVVSSGSSAAGWLIRVDKGCVRCETSFMRTAAVALQRKAASLGTVNITE